MMGIPRDREKTKQNIDTEATDNKEEQCVNNIGTTCEEIDLFGAEEYNYDDDDDDLPTEYVAERERDDKIHRFEWNNDASDTAEKEVPIASGSVFDSVLQIMQGHHEGIDNPKTKEGKPFPLWDDLFESKNGGVREAKADTKAGLDDLLCLFEDQATNSKQNTSCSGQTVEEKQRIDVSLLSQDAQEIANKMVSGVLSQKKTAATLEDSCPNWKENIYFALLQKDQSEIREALENVKQTRVRMQALKEQLLKTWECKNATLEVFEKALETSFTRSNQNISASSLKE